MSNPSRLVCTIAKVVESLSVWFMVFPYVKSVKVLEIETLVVTWKSTKTKAMLPPPFVPPPFVIQAFSIYYSSHYFEQASS